MVAWSGSFFIFYATLLSPPRHLPPDLPAHQQVMRPMILTQLVFAGYMCCSSIFYFMDHHGYHFLTRQVDPTVHPEDQIYLIAECQRICLLGHAALVTGILSNTTSILPPKYRINIDESKLLTITCLTSYFFAFLSCKFPGTAQFALMLFNLGLFCSATLLIKGIHRAHVGNICLGAGIMLINISVHIFSGYKETIISYFIILAFLSYPYYRKLTRTAVVPIAIALFLVLPNFTKNIRKIAWDNETKITDMQKIDYLNLLEETSLGEIEHDNWDFLTNRLSEIGMFTGYINTVPESRPYYGFEILENAILALIPRIAWQEKPNTEKIAMERVYELGIVNRASNVSAKSRPIVDGYLSCGLPGVFILLFLYGYLAQSLCNLAENRFGGYSFGCTVVFNSLFQQLWRGNNLEFLLNNIVYGTAMMMFIFWIMKVTGVLIPRNHADTHHPIL